MSRPLEPGSIIGRDFKVVRALASGNMGSVYITEQLSTGKQRAMKVMSPELANNEKARERFVLEARVGAQIESDHVVEVVTAGIDEPTGMPYLVMELLKGEDLAEKLRREGPLPLSAVVEIVKQAGHALEMAHKLGIAHRDIKPENLFIAESRREGVPFTVKVLDFGIAKLVAERTHEGTQAIGTPLFMAPEQTERGGKITAAADVWPLGLITYFMLTGDLYWMTWTEGVTALLREVVLDPMVPASQRAQEQQIPIVLPQGFDGWFERCVTRDLTMRFPEAGAATRAFVAMARAAGANVGSTIEQAPAARPSGDTAETGATLFAPDVTAAIASDAPPPPDGPSPAKTAARSTAAGKTAGQTNMEASASLIEPGKAAGGSRAPIALVAVALAAGVGIYFFGFAGDKGDQAGKNAIAPPSAAAASAPAVRASAATSVATSAAAPVATGCPAAMVLISGGKMYMGSKDDDLSDDVRPPHQVTVSSYCLDRTEVTTEAYEACSTAGECARAPTTVQFAGLEKADKKPFSELCNAGHADRAKHPINCVEWAMAEGYCKGHHGRLPTEAEWEFAARGSRQSNYPWGDEQPGPKRLNACDAQCKTWMAKAGLKAPALMFDGDDGFSGTAPVGSFPDGASSAGVLDLAGNVWEWTADWYGPYSAEPRQNPKGPDKGELRVMRGGAFNGSKPAWAKPAFRYRTDPTDQSHGVGFRCAADPK